MADQETDSVEKRFGIKVDEIVFARGSVPETVMQNPAIPRVG